MGVHGRAFLGRPRDVPLEESTHLPGAILQQLQDVPVGPPCSARHPHLACSVVRDVRIGNSLGEGGNFVEFGGFQSSGRRGYLGMSSPRSPAKPQQRQVLGMTMRSAQRLATNSRSVVEPRCSPEHVG